MKYYLGIDQSKRSTGCVLLDENGFLVDFLLISNHADDNEDLIIDQFRKLGEWLDSHLDYFENDKVFALIEGLAFRAVGSGKDFLAGLQWYFRANFKDFYGTYLGTIPVTMWRSKVLNKDEQRIAKAESKDGLKKAVVMKLPAEVRTAFAKYVELNKESINKAKVPSLKDGSKSLKYQEGIYDLADAYFIAKHRFQLSTNR